eukprot:TRINITY_DN44847_c0_g1_i1.p1 TRINITY_DN44847_c0_g1~~TRINITY_DN44847_c0_g1_i1.p1  ORF type:complete len:103 (-),score=27.52 TRINITY_DN44847_c0_g1_i1:15-323(-)
MVKEALKGLAKQPADQTVEAPSPEAQTVEGLARRCQELEQQLEMEKSCNFGLAGRVQHLEGEVLAKGGVYRCQPGFGGLGFAVAPPLPLPRYAAVRSLSPSP